MSNKPTRTKDETTGREILVYADGARKWADTGHWLNGPTDPAHNPVRADPKGMLRLRNEKSRQAASDAIDEAAFPLDNSKWGTGDGWKELIRHTAQVYLASRNIRGMGEVLSKLGMASGHMSKDEAERSEHPRNMAYMPPDVIMELIREIEAETAARVEKARAIDAEAT